MIELENHKLTLQQSTHTKSFTLFQKIGILECITNQLIQKIFLQFFL